MRKRLFTVFLAILPGCEGAVQAPKLPVHTSPAPLPVQSTPTEAYGGKCGCHCGSPRCLYGNCGVAGSPACCGRCTCIKSQNNSTIEEINNASNEVLNLYKPDEPEGPPPSLPGPSDSAAQPPKIVDSFEVSIPEINVPRLPDPEPDPEPPPTPVLDKSEPSVRISAAKPIDPPRRGWIPVNGRPGLWAYGVVRDINGVSTILNVELWYQYPVQPTVTYAPIYR